MLKILHIITGLKDGGAEAVLHRLCTGHSDGRHHVVSMMGDDKYAFLLRDAGITVTCLNMPQGRITLGGVWQLWRLLRKEKPEAVQTWMYHADLVGGVLARLAGITNVCWGVHHTTLDTKHSKKSTIFVAKACAWLSRWVPANIVCCAQKALEVHRELGYDPKKLVVIANGYDLSRFVVDEEARNLLREEWGIGNRYLLGMVGRFDPLKDHRNFLSALAILKERRIEFCAVLIGCGLNDSNSLLKRWLREFELECDVTLLGQRDDIPNVMNALDVHVLSSTSEAFPNVVAEAMACGTPVVTTDVGDAALIAANTGWVVQPKDAVQLADALVRARLAMIDHKEWIARRTAARQQVEQNYSLSRMVARYGTLWSEGQL